MLLRSRLPPAAAAKLSQWIKRDVFELDPAVPDPGRVTVRRLNRVEYRNTVRDLTGVEVDTKLNFPVDDSGHGFDNIGDVLTVSPMLLSFMSESRRMSNGRIKAELGVRLRHPQVGPAVAAMALVK